MWSTNMCVVYAYALGKNTLGSKSLTPQKNKKKAENKQLV